VPQPPDSDVRIRIDGYDFEEWENYQIESNIFQPSDAFSFTAPNEGGALNDKVHKFDAVDVIVEGTPQMTGWVDAVNKNGDANSGATLEIVGRDKFGQLLDVDAEPQTITGLDIGQIATKLSAAFVQFWRFENEVNRQKLLLARRNLARANQEDLAAEKVLREKLIPLSKANFADAPLQVRLDVSQKVASNYRANLKDPATTNAIKKAQANLAAIKRVIYPRVKVEPGQKIHEVIQALAEKQGFALWMAADGTGVIAKPNYQQRPLYSVFLYPLDSPDRGKNNVLSWSIKDDGTEQYASYRLVGSGANTIKSFGVDSQYDEKAVDAEVPIDRKLIVSGRGQNKTEAKLELSRDRDWRNFNALQLNYTFQGHRQNGKLWQIDTIAQVVDKVNGYSGQFYVTRRRFTTDINGGQITEVTMHPKGLWLA
jgi:prophage tail gpP-like protein